MSWVGGGAHEEKGGTGTTLRIKKFGKSSVEKSASNKNLDLPK